MIILLSIGMALTIFASIMAAVEARRLRKQQMLLIEDHWKLTCRDDRLEKEIKELRQIVAAQQARLAECEKYLPFYSL